MSPYMALSSAGKNVFTVLWEYFTGVLPDAQVQDSLAAIQLLGMCAVAEPNIITSNVQVKAKEASVRPCIEKTRVFLPSSCR